MLEKNTAGNVAEALHTLHDSDCVALKSILFAAAEEAAKAAAAKAAAAAAADAAPGTASPHAVARYSRPRRRAHPPTVSRTFRLQLTSLVGLLEATQMHFVRCIKPNGARDPARRAPRPSSRFYCIEGRPL